MTATRRTRTTEAVLAVFADGGVHYGYELVQSTGLPTGTLYPILARLEDRGVIRSWWEDEPEFGRPRRRYYQEVNSG